MELWYCTECRVVVFQPKEPTYCPSAICRGGLTPSRISKFEPVETPLDDEIEEELAYIAWGGY